MGARRTTTLVIALLAWSAAPSFAVPAAVPYVAALTDDAGAPLDGPVDVEIGLFEQADGGEAVWGPHLFGDVPVESGLLSLVLGGAGSVPLDADVLAGGTIYLEVRVDGTLLLPRQEVLSVPYALLAGDAERLGGEPAASFVTDAELPDFSGYARTADLQPLCFSASWADLREAPHLADVAVTGAYGDLTGRPDLAVYLRADGTVALAGDLDAAGHRILNVAIDSGATPPTAPVPGQLWWDPASAALKVWSGERWLAAGGDVAGGAATDLSCTGCVTEEALAFPLAPVARSGAYDDLAGTPDISGFARAEELSSVCVSGSYTDLRDLPVLAPVTETGSWFDLVDRPDLAGFVHAADLAAVATSGRYVDLSGAPDLARYALTADLRPVCLSGSFADLEDVPTLAPVAESGSYEDLTDRPDLGSFVAADQLAPVALTGAFADLEDAPDPADLLRRDGSVALAADLDAGGHRIRNLALEGAPTPPAAPAVGQVWWQAPGGGLRVWNGEEWVSPGAIGVATDLQCSECVTRGELAFPLSSVALSGAYRDIAGTPDLSTYAQTADLADVARRSELAAVALSGAYVDLAGVPVLAPVAESGDWADLEGRPDLDAFARTQDLPAVCTSGSYADLRDAPSLAPVAESGAYDDLEGRPDLSVFLRSDGSVALEGDLDLGGHRLIRAAVERSDTAPTEPVAGQLWFDETRKTLLVWTDTKWLDLGSSAGGGATPPLAAVSGGTLTNFFEEAWPSPSVPADVPDASPAGVEVAVTVTDSGSLRSLSIFVWIVHPDPRELLVTMQAPNGETFTLHDHDAGDANGLQRTYSFGDPGSSGLGTLLGTNPTGTWKLRVVDTVESPGAQGGVGGGIGAFRVDYEVHRETSVGVVGDATVDGTLTVDDVDIGATLNRLSGELWCMKNCDPLRKGDCRDRSCNGEGETCTDAGPMADGQACAGGAGRCTRGVCCVPQTCDQLGKACGSWKDGCGGEVHCGGCPSNEFACNSVGQCAWNESTCGNWVCPTLPGYATTCNAQVHCEYAFAGEDPAPWRDWDVWIWVPPGVFPMGGDPEDEEHEPDEEPLHTVTIAGGFFIAKYEIVTTGYETCEDTGLCTPRSTADWDADGWGTNRSANGRWDHPANGLQWQQAADFCAFAGGRLPTEAEWAYAAKGPTQRRYPWGDTPAPTCLNRTAVFCATDQEDDDPADWGCGSADDYGCGSGGTMTVGSMPAGAAWSGAMDMGGSLWEWTLDWYHPDFGGAPTNGSAWIYPIGTRRTLRGGGFDSGAPSQRATERDADPPGARFASLGARCARDQQQ